MKNTGKNVGSKIVYHANHLPKVLPAEYEYTHDWAKVTDPAALKTRIEALRSAGKVDQAIELETKAENKPVEVEEKQVE